MDLRIGVLGHTVMQHKFKEKKHKEEKGGLARSFHLFDELGSSFLKIDNHIYSRN